MEQATATTPTASPETRALDVDRQEYQRASALMDRIVGQLTTLPRSAAVVGDLTGFRVQLNFGTNDPRGVLEFATITDTPTARQEAGFSDGLWLEARTTIEGIPVRAEVLLSLGAAAAFEAQTPPPNPGPADTVPAPVPAPEDDAASPAVQAGPTVVPLGASVAGHHQAVVVPVQPATAPGLETGGAL
ncbi:hypothetical protein [Streptomyces turgidiscabies]|uniref:hypothetical protein n=1 Tax=Streptomyces turgidiscabies TaxID=85558 RepID=UPI0038F7DD5B